MLDAVLYNILEGALFTDFISSSLKLPMILVMWLALIGAINSCASNHIICLLIRKPYQDTTTNQISRLVYKESNQIARKWKTTFVTFYNQLATRSIKYLWTKILTWSGTEFTISNWIIYLSGNWTSCCAIFVWFQIMHMTSDLIIYMEKLLSSDWLR